MTAEGTHAWATFAAGELGAQLFSADSVAALWTTWRDRVADPACASEFLYFAKWALQLYAQAVWVGPELSDAQKAALPKVLSDPEPLSVVEGEALESLAEFRGALFLARAVLAELQIPEALQWRARAALMLHRSLVGGIEQCTCPGLKREALSAIVAYAQRLGALPQNFDITDDSGRCLSDLFSTESLTGSCASVEGDARDRVLLEVLSVMTHYGFGNSFHAYLQSHPALWSHHVTLTGRMGIKRVHQVDPVAQLTVQVSSNQAARADDSTTETEVPREIALGDIDANNDVLSRPKFTDEGDSDQRTLSMVERFYLLACAALKMSQTGVFDPLTMNSIVTLTTEVLHDPSAPERPSTAASSSDPEPMSEMRANADWALWGTALYLRSRAEFQRSKMKERACLQILLLEEQCARPSPPAAARLESLWLTSYPNKWELRREVAKKFLQLGAPLTARDMYVKVHMWNDVIECLLKADRRNEAKDVVVKQLELEPESPLLWCLSGDVTREIDHYLKSWELSKHSYHRAARSLGRYYAEVERNAKAAIPWFAEAVRIQPYEPATQFTYGCLLMRQGDLKSALPAFTAVISYDEDNYQAWANLGAIHCQMEQWASAKKCLQIAAQRAQKEWRIWDSYVKVCYKLEDPMAAFDGLQHMVNLDAVEHIQIWMLYRLVVKVTEYRPGVTKNDFVARVLEFFKQLHHKLRMPLPSQLNHGNPKNAFDSEPIRVCVDRFRIWCLLTDALNLNAESYELSLKGARHVLRIIEDCLNHEPPKTLWSEHDTYADLVRALMKLWHRSIADIERFRDRLADHNGAEERRSEATRFYESSNTKLVAQIQGCSLISKEDRASVIAEFLSG